MRNRFLYRHIRCDNNTVFYIGIGTHRTVSSKYYRAYQRNFRHAQWNDIINKTNYIIEIVLDNLTKQEAEEKEIEFIALYGRIGYEQNGTLVNCATGGVKGYRQSESAKKKISEFNKGKKVAPDVIERIRQSNIGKKRSDEVRKKMSISRTGINLRGDSPSAKIVIDTVTGQEFACVKDAADSIGMAHSTLYAKLIGKWKVNTTNFIYK